MEAGDRVQVTEYRGRKLILRVVANRGESIVVCNEEEYKRAASKGRGPDGIGFPRQSVRLLGDSSDGKNVLDLDRKHCHTAVKVARWQNSCPWSRQ